MDEELPKRNTDCVYFLASPLTCKKGVDCEYRHSEIARLNPRDCWYWSSGNCLNPTCGFRHPPMDSNSETSAQAELFPNKALLPPTKNKVPCYFYFNGYCGKGDKCTFLHGSEDPSARKVKIESSSTGAPTLTIKSPSKASVPKITTEKTDNVSLTLLKNNRSARMTYGMPDPPEMALKTSDEVSLHQKMQIQSSDTYTVVEHKVPSEFEGLAMSKLASLDPPENIGRSDLSVYSDENSEDQVDKDSVRDEWWESSPGFDVLVEGKSEGVNYGVEQEYMHVYNDLYDGNVEDQFLDPHYREYSDRLLHENRIREASYYSDNDDERYELNDYYHGDRGRNDIMSHKRKLPTIGLRIGGHHYCEDLREHLSKRRFHEERDPNFPLYIQERQRQPPRSSNQRLNGRLTSKVERSGVSFTAEQSAFVVPDQKGRDRSTEHNTRHNHHHVRKRLQNSPRVQMTPFSRKTKETDDNISFAPPKTLAQIKEEKYRRRSSGGEEDVNIVF